MNRWCSKMQNYNRKPSMKYTCEWETPGIRKRKKKKDACKHVMVKKKKIISRTCTHLNI